MTTTAADEEACAAYKASLLAEYAPGDLVLGLVEPAVHAACFARMEEAVRVRREALEA